MAKRVCVIGAGMCGLGSIKSCLEENLNVTCFEKTDSVGGLWTYRDETIEGVGSVMKSTLMNTSKELTSFSDYPPPKHFPCYFPQELMGKYLEMYARHFQLLQYIQFETEVISVKPSSDYIQTGRWNVAVKKKNNVTIEETFDNVVVASGHHSYPYRPEINGLNDFKGEVYHTRDVKDGEKFKDKRVLVVGLGNSGSDVAVEISRTAKQVFVSCRSGAWINSRLAERGVPLDTRFITRIYGYLMYYTSYQILNMIAEARANLRFDHNLYCVKPKHGFFNQHVTINDELPTRIITGKIVIKDDIHRLTENGVIFRNTEDSTETIDYVVLATGYDIQFPYLEEGILKLDDHRPRLYKYVFPVHLPHPTLAFVGLLQVQGPLTPLAEMQSRWITRVFKGLCYLPSEETMMADVERKRWELDQRFVQSRRHGLQVDYIWYQDEIAKLIDVKPSFRFMAFSDPTLFWACVSGAHVPYIYRLVGPHSWKGARDAILNAPQRMLTPLKTRLVEDGKESSVLENLYVAPVFTIIFAVLITILLSTWLHCE